MNCYLKMIYSKCYIIFNLKFESTLRFDSLETNDMILVFEHISVHCVIEHLETL